MLKMTLRRRFAISLVMVLRPKTNEPACAPRRGFTLVELLVVIAIVGVLVFLLLPAIQISREAVRRSACRNNLRQMGVALSMHHNTMQSFPVGCTDLGGKQISWVVNLLPFLEEDHLREKFRTDRKFNHADNRSVISVVLPVLLCPSTVTLAPGRELQTIGDKNGNGTYDPGDHAAVTDYGGNFGAGLYSPPDNGVLIYEKAIRFKDIKDGSSHTIAVSEDTGRGWLWDGEWANGGNVFDQVGPVNVQQNNEMWSDHPSGVNTLLCDGSARFIANAIEVNTLRAKCTRAGLEVIQEGDGP